MAEDTRAPSGMDPKLASLLCYLCSWLTGLIFLLIEKNDRTVRFHAWHSIFFALAIFAVYVAVLIVQFVGMFVSQWLAMAVGLISVVLWIATLAVWIALMVKAYQGSFLRLPFVTDFARKMADK